MTAKATSSIQVIARASRLFDALATHDQPVSLKTLAGMAELHPSTAFRILASLIEHGFVERSANGHYRLGVRLQQLGNRREAPLLKDRLYDPASEPGHGDPPSSGSRQFHDEGRALPDFALHPNAPAVVFNDFLADRQA